MNGQNALSRNSFATFKEEQIVNPNDCFSEKAEVVVVRVARSKKLMDGIIGVRLNWNKHTVEDLMEMEVR